MIIINSVHFSYFLKTKLLGINTFRFDGCSFLFEKRVNNKQIQMRKKHEKVVLKSDVFKSKTPQKLMNTSSKSPISRSPYMTRKDEEKIDPNELFQKVCCPNCRFIFKIIKNGEMLVNLASQKKEKVVNVMTQTEEQLFKEVKELKALSNSISKQLSPKNMTFFTKTNSRNNQMDKIAQASIQTEHLNNSTYRFQDPGTSRLNANKPNLKSSIKPADKRSETSSSQLFEQNKSNTFSKDKSAQNKQLLQLQKFNASKGELRDVLQSLQKKVREAEPFVSFCHQIKLTYQMPSFQKMLLYQLSVND